MAVERQQSFLPHLGADSTINVFDRRAAEQTLDAAKKLAWVDQLNLTPMERNEILLAMTVGREQGKPAAGAGQEKTGLFAGSKPLDQALCDVPLAALKFLIVPDRPYNRDRRETA